MCGMSLLLDKSKTASRLATMRKRSSRFWVAYWTASANSNSWRDDGEIARQAVKIWCENRQQFILINTSRSAEAKMSLFGFSTMRSRNPPRRRMRERSFEVGRGRCCPRKSILRDRTQQVPAPRAIGAMRAPRQDSSCPNSRPGSRRPRHTHRPQPRHRLSHASRS